MVLSQSECATLAANVPELANIGCVDPNTNVDFGHTAFILVCMALVNLMTPGLAFFYGGLVRERNSLTIMMQSYVSMGIITVVWIVVGFSLAFGEDAVFVGSPASFPMLANLGGTPMLIDGEAFVTGIPGVAFARYQGMFAVSATLTPQAALPQPGAATA